jgi:hypothetical protein
MSRVIALDTEWYYDSQINVGDLGAWNYFRRSDCYMVSVSDGADHWAGHPRDFRWESLEGATLVAHNAGFDEEGYLALVEAGKAPRVAYAAWHCTADLSAYVCQRRSLADAVFAAFGETVSKDMRKYMRGKHWVDVVRNPDPDENGVSAADRLLQYARDDAMHCWRLWEKWSPMWPDWERELSLITRLQGRAGVTICVERLERDIKLLERLIICCIDRLPWVEAGAKPASPIAIAQACRDAGIPPPPVKARDAIAAEKWEEEYGSATPWLHALKSMRKAKKMLASLQTMRDRLRPDGTLPFSLKYFGAHTGRWSGESGLNFQNFNRDSMLLHEDISGLGLVATPETLASLRAQLSKNPDCLA